MPLISWTRLTFDLLCKFIQISIWRFQKCCKGFPDDNEEEEEDLTHISILFVHTSNRSKLHLMCFWSTFCTYRSQDLTIGLKSLVSELRPEWCRQVSKGILREKRVISQTNSRKSKSRNLNLFTVSSCPTPQVCTKASTGMCSQVLLPRGHLLEGFQGTTPCSKIKTSLLNCKKKLNTCMWDRPS